MLSRCLFLSVFIFNIWATTPPPRNYLNDYAWRDFEGGIHDDAFKGGKDRLGNPIYIAQALYENKLIPGKVYGNDPNTYFEWYNKEYSRKQNIKIFCTSTPDKFQWIPTESDKVVLLTNKILIKGGYEDPNYTVYLGRALINGETLVGKVICSAQDCLGFYTTSDGVAKNLKRFEILSYNSDSSESEIKFDVRNDNSP